MSKIIIELEDVNEDGIDKIRTVVRYAPPKNWGLATKAERFADALTNVIAEANGTNQVPKH